MKMKSKVLRGMSTIMAGFAMVAVNVAITQSCFIFYHQPKMPDKLKQHSNDKNKN